MKWFDNIIRRAWERATERDQASSPSPPRTISLHGDLSDVLNGRVCAMIYHIDNGFILTNQDPNRNQIQYLYVKDAVEAGEVIARQLTLQRMGVVQGSSIRGASTSGPSSMTVGPGQAKISVNPSF